MSNYYLKHLKALFPKKYVNKQTNNYIYLEKYITTL